MSLTINRAAYEKLVREDLEWLLNNTYRTLERDHIVMIIEQSVEFYYGDAQANEARFIVTDENCKLRLGVIDWNIPPGEYTQGQLQDMVTSHIERVTRATPVIISKHVRGDV